MELTRRSLLVYGLLVAVWVLVLGWQVEEHLRVKEAAKTDLRNRSKDIANTLSAIIRGMRFRGGAIPQERLEPVLNELVHGRTNELVKSSELISIALLDANNTPLVLAGRPMDPQREEQLFQSGEHWGERSVTLVNPIILDVTNTFIPPPLSEVTNRMGEASEARPARSAARAWATRVCPAARSPMLLRPRPAGRTAARGRAGPLPTPPLDAGPR